MTVDHRALLMGRARAAYDAYNRRDWDGFFEWLDSEYEFVPGEEGTAYRGREEVFSYFERWHTTRETPQRRFRALCAKRTKAEVVTPRSSSRPDRRGMCSIAHPIARTLA